MKRSPSGREQGPSSPRARDKVFAVATDRFYREGIRSVGVESIVKDAGVTKISLYRNFPSKDDLVLAYLQDLPIYKSGVGVSSSTGMRRSTSMTIRIRNCGPS
ncbi:TetR/AcrR family transcriptional regulator [Methylobacterium terricola]|nr:TetR/AcrR family transcriptional regulator [Methylobacterium terricola]